LGIGDWLVRGFCGWQNFDSASRPAIDVVAKMAMEWDSAEVVSEGRSALKLPGSQVQGMHLYHGDDEFSVLSGLPWTDSDIFSAAVAEHGVAKACLLAYKQDGAAFLADIKGHFSLVISLGKQAQLLLAVDRVGIDPVFYSPSEKGLAFASNLRFLRGCSELNLSVDLQSIYHYLYFHVIPSPGSIYKGVHRLVPGSYLEVVEGHCHAQRYWQVEYRHEDSHPDPGPLKAEFKNLLRVCVKKELDAATDVGCFLSGGTDSSTLAGVLNEVVQGQARTYSIGFDQKGFDEMEYARLAARHFGTEHHEYYVTPDDIVSLVPKIGQAYGEPFGNSSVIPTYYCAQMAKADGINKLLGGDGGDELFGGNERYATQVLFSYYSKLPEQIREKLIEPFLQAVPFGDRIMPVRKLKRYIDQARIPLPDRLETYNHLNMLGQDTVIERSFLDAVDQDGPINSLREVYADAHGQHFVNKMLALDLKFTLGDNDLPKVGRMCELAGVNVGYPFLQSPMLDFTAGLPADFKVKGLKIRYFFKEALRDYLPTEIIQKQKHGFGLPFGDWLISHNALRSQAFDSLEGLKGRQIIRADFINDLRDHKIREHPNYYGGLVWLLMILEQWFETNSVSL
jgi:asparagine synthase (glutamine-hydrolysing)